YSLFAVQTKPSIKFSGTIQGMYDHSAEETGNSFNEWRIKRALFSSNMNVNQWLRFRIGVNMASQRVMRDVYVNFVFSNNLELKIGQFKIPFSREELNPASQLLVVDRGETNDLFTDNYYQSWDLGSVFIVKNTSDRIHLEVGLFNGQGKNKPRDNNHGKAVVGRITMQPHTNVEIALATIHNPVSSYLFQSGHTEWARAYEGDYHVDLGKWILEGECRVGDNWKAGPAATMYGLQQFVLYQYPYNHSFINLLEPGIKIEYLNKNHTINRNESWYYIPNMGFYFFNIFRFQMDLIYTRLPGGKSITKFAAQLQIKFS
ncbi:MAG: OprO/OprP family phosphate-selective porin, partial [Patescibacteria group bacterium]|nr:OprO/OprP family phosphate-selective porin [Patescibacteria group bacterium]